MRQNDDDIKVYCFGMNDENGRLIDIHIPAKSGPDATRRIKRILFTQLCEDAPENYFWLNSVEDYK